MPKLTHFDDNGNPNMVDVSQKETTVRIAEASGYVHMEKATLNTVLNKEISKEEIKRSFGTHHDVMPLHFCLFLGKLLALEFQGVILVLDEIESYRVEG